MSICCAIVFADMDLHQGQAALRPKRCHFLFSMRMRLAFEVTRPRSGGTLVQYTFSKRVVLCQHSHKIIDLIWDLHVGKQSLLFAPQHSEYS